MLLDWFAAHSGYFVVCFDVTSVHLILIDAVWYSGFGSVLRGWLCFGFVFWVFISEFLGFCAFKVGFLDSSFGFLCLMQVAFRDCGLLKGLVRFGGLYFVVCGYFRI